MSLVLSLFPGIGLLDMAFEEEGFCMVRGPDVLWGGDVRTFHAPRDRFDGVIGGPPCQTFSALANLVRANGYEPKFGNLIPEFERVVGEAAPAWFLMENVPAAPLPVVPGYGIHSFVIDHCALDGGDGYGLEQERKRRISFGLRDGRIVDLRRWITPATLLLPAAGSPRAVTSSHVDNSAAARTRIVTASQSHFYPTRSPAVSSAHQGEGKGPRERSGPVSSSDGSTVGMKPMRRYKLAEACRLQGLPEDFLADAPFTADAKLKAVANGVPIPLGRALAHAIGKALADRALAGVGVGADVEDVPLAKAIEKHA